ncbi:MAG: carboxypeptidase-like regulatory domain-containing protein [Solidesulfovibrio sp. DCME]|uniref:carboxypeptidase-like regulatory domain-containing protein n=1 Tax=Solidesulfovibrio sp. DCME TaxID=3447380 RepID=UPI003D0E0274
MPTSSHKATTTLLLLTLVLSLANAISCWAEGTTTTAPQAGPQAVILEALPSDNASCGPAAKADATGVLTGVITANGEPLSGATVNIEQRTYDCSTQGGSGTGANGSYTITMAAGSYYLKVTPPQGEAGNILAPYYYENQYLQCGEAQLVTLVAGQTTTLNIDLTQAGGLITGTVVSYDGKPTSGAYVYCSRDIDRMSYGTSTNSSGNFTAGPFYPASDYKCFLYDNGQPIYYNNTTYANRTPITVEANAVTSGINFTLSKPSGSKTVVVPLN